MAALFGGPLTDNVSQASTPFDTTLDEKQTADVQAGADAMPAVQAGEALIRDSNRTGIDPAAIDHFGINSGAPSDPRNPGSDVDAMAAERGDAPTRTMMSADDAKAQARDAGVSIDFGTAPIASSDVASVIQHHVDEAQRASVQQRYQGGLGSTIASAATGLIMQAADPLNIAAFAIPGAPEAFVAEKLAAAGSALERTLIRGAAGAAEGATGMAALVPLEAATASGNYDNYTAGDAMRSIFTGAALGAGGHVLLGSVFGDSHITAPPESRLAAVQTAVVQTLDRQPVEAEGILGAGEATRTADALERTPSFADAGPYPVSRTARLSGVEGGELPSHGLYLNLEGETHYPDAGMGRQSFIADPQNPLRVDPAPANAPYASSAGTEAARALLGDDETNRLLSLPHDEAAAEATARGITIPDNVNPTQRLTEVLGAQAAKDAGHDAIIMDGKTSHGEPPEMVALDKSILKDPADFRAKAQAAASDNLNKILHPPTDPLETRMQQSAAAVEQRAPKVTGDPVKDLGEATKMEAAAKAQYDQHVKMAQADADKAAGEAGAEPVTNSPEHLELQAHLDAADEIERQGKAAADYAMCAAERL